MTSGSGEMGRKNF